MKEKTINWYKYGWLIPLIFIVGYVSTFLLFDEFSLDYFSLNVFSFLACCLLLTRLGPPLIKKLPIWIIFSYFLAFYFIKFYLLIIMPWDIPFTGAELLHQSEELAIDVFETTSYAFIVFCVTAWFLLYFSRNLTFNATPKNIKYKPVVSFLKRTVPILMIMTGAVMYIFNIKAGINEYLPFRLAGWTVYIRAILIPALLLLLIYFGNEANQKKNVKLGIGLLFLHGISEVLLKTSKAGLLFPFLMLALLLIITRQMTKKHMKLLVSIILITIILFPVIGIYRYTRASNTAVSSSFGEALLLSTEILSYSELMAIEVAGIIGRFVGVDFLTYIINAHFKPLYFEAFFGDSTISDVMKEAMGVPLWAQYGIAPGLLGWFYLVGGSSFVSIGIAGLTILVWLIWRGIAKAKLYCTPIAQTLFLFLLITICSEGMLLSQVYLQILVIGGSVSVCEWMVRQYKIKKRLRPKYAKIMYSASKE